MSSAQEQLKAGIDALEAQRATLGDTVVDIALAPLRDRLAALAADAAASNPPADARQALRQVTILFLDVVGSTALSRRLDPEDLQVVIDGSLLRCTAAVQSHGGKVLQYAGDSLLAVFGADESREDDAERAVHCGLALLDEGRSLGAETMRRYGHDACGVRVGLHTGGVLLGGGVDADSSIRGMAVNIAARMEQTAPAGALRISHDTYRHVRGVFNVEPQPPILIKGIAEPVVTYLVRSAKPRAFRVATRGIEGVETRMVGRDAELEALQQAFLGLYGRARLAIVTVVAEAGLGKSRLLYEFENWAEARPEPFYILQGRAQPQTQSQPYGLLRDILAWRLQIDDSDSMDVAKRKIEQGIVPLFAAGDGADMAQAHAHLLGHLIGLDFADSPHIRGVREDARQIRDRGFHAAAQMLRQIAARDATPIVMLLDDLHWGDDGTLDFLDHLAKVNSDLPMLMLALTRPALFDRRPHWDFSGSGGGCQRIELGPLGKADSHALADELLKPLAEIPDALRQLVTGGAEGNPFYMEELIKMLIDGGAIEVGPQRWTVVPHKLLATPLPSTLTGVLQARLDGLKPGEKLALQQASVIGFVFWDQALAAIDTRSTAALPCVVQRALVLQRQDASFEGVREFAFHHQLLHQVTYDTVLKRHRREYHARTAQWLAGLSGSRVNDFLGATAEHFERAANHARAGEFFSRAAEHAAERFAHDTALGYAARALALLGTDRPDSRWRLFDLRERIFDVQGRRDEQREDLSAQQSIAEALGDDSRRARVALRRSSLAMRLADFAAQAAAARQALALAEGIGDAVLGIEAKFQLALALGNLGDAAAGSALAHDGLAAARTLGLRRLESKLLNALSVIASQRDDLVATLALDRQALLIDRELGDRPGEAITLSNLGTSYLRLGDWTQAQRCLDASWQLTRSVGDRASEPYPLIGLSRVALRQGDYRQALTHGQAALDIAVAVQEPVAESVARWSIGNAELALDHHAPAAQAFAHARALASTIDSVSSHDACVGQARLALAQGDLAAALAAVAGLADHLAAAGTLEGAEAPHLARLVCYQVLARAGDSRADAVLAGAHTQLQARAATITDDALRHGFLNNIPEHRDISAAWAARRAADPGGR